MKKYIDKYKRMLIFNLFYPPMYNKGRDRLRKYRQDYIKRLKSVGLKCKDGHLNCMKYE